MADKVTELAESVFARETKRRPEAQWIQQQAERLAQTRGISGRGETDRLIFEKMYARTPAQKDTVKIRYWRTGRHLPTSREEALLFAGALEMGRKETLYFLQACMEKSDTIFEEPPVPEDGQSALYRKRTALMERMISEYIAQVPPARIIQLNIPYERLAMYARHLYCMDAVCATALYGKGKRNLKTHFSSVNYESEFLRIRKLLGEIPRRAMLRHIFLLGIPYLNRRLIDERLEGLGYLPLTEGHTGTRGELLDDLVIGFLGLYEEACAGQEPLVCRGWLFDRLYALDCYLRDVGKEEYRFLYFRSLASMMSDGEE